MPPPATLTTRNNQETTNRRRLTDCSADCDRIQSHAAACITVDLMGGLRVRAGLTDLGPRDLGGTKLRRVLLALLLHRGAPVPKDRLISMLWEGSAPSGAKATLESYVCVLRKKLQPCHGALPSLIKTQAGCYSIDMSRVELDLVRYESLMARALHADTPASEALPMLQRAVAMSESPLLPEENDCEWLDEVRKIQSREVRKNLVAAAGKVAGLSSESPQKWARMALEGDSLDESAWHALLLSMEASGQHANGLRAYDHCRRLFAAELGCAPGPGLQEVYVRLLRGANGNNEELSVLFDAVVRLHAASQLSALSAIPALKSRRSDITDQDASIEQAHNALDLLLRSAGGGKLHPKMALGA